jgi:hypothetical protein
MISMLTIMTSNKQNIDQQHGLVMENSKETGISKGPEVSASHWLFCGLRKNAKQNAKEEEGRQCVQRLGCGSLSTR